jgi:hypothetical protein
MCLYIYIYAYVYVYTCVYMCTVVYTYSLELGHAIFKHVASRGDSATLKPILTLSIIVAFVYVPNFVVASGEPGKSEILTM